MLKLAFYRAGSGDLIDRMIDACSGKYGYSHVELVFNDGEAFSSSPFDLMPDGATFGVRFKPIDFTKHPERWAFHELPAISAADEAAIRDWAGQCAREGHPYDFAAICHFVDPWISENPNDYFCSEVCLAALQSRGFFDELIAANTSPNAWAKSMGMEHG
jgi:hypothetical protein